MEDFDKLLQQVKSYNIDVSILIVCAGLLSTGSLENVEPEEGQAVMDVNMYHPTAIIKKFLPELIERANDGEKIHSAVVLVSSLTDGIAGPNVATYAASKAYLTYLGKGLS